jgi:cytoskeletal protein CcmA (bactofilin family)
MLFSRKSESRQTPMPPIPAPVEARKQMRERVPAPPPVGATVAGGVDEAHTQSFIDASLTIVGDLFSRGDVRIDGRICGNVRCAQLILGRDAAVTGSITADQAIVRGKVIGTIRAMAVIIQDSAHVESEITYASLSVDDGAFFEGAVHRRDNPMAEMPADVWPLEAQPATDAGDAEPQESFTHSPEAASSAAAATSEPQPPNANAPLPNGHAPVVNGHT